MKLLKPIVCYFFGHRVYMPVRWSAKCLRCERVVYRGNDVEG